MDNASQENTQGLLRIADEIISSQQTMLEAVCRELTSDFPGRPGEAAA
jgi:hypothetical protein